MSNSLTIQNSTIYTITGTSWVSPILDTTKSWIITNIGGTPIELIVTDTSYTPNDTERRQYTIGGIMNDLVIPKTKKGWFRCTNSTDTGILSVRDANLGEIDMVTELRKSLIDQNIELIKLTDRVTDTEIRTRDVSNRLEVHEYVIQNVQSSLADMIVDNMNRYLSLNQKILDIKIGLESYIRSYYNQEISDLNATMVSMQGIIADIIDQFISNMPTLRLRMRTLEQKMDDLNVDPRIAELESVMPSIQYMLVSLMEQIVSTIPALKINIALIKNSIIELAQDAIINLVPGNTVSLESALNVSQLAFSILDYYNTVQYAYRDVYFKYRSEQIEYDEDVFEYRFKNTSYQLLTTGGKNSQAWEDMQVEFATTYPEMSQYLTIYRTLQRLYFNLAQMFPSLSEGSLSLRIQPIIDDSYTKAKEHI